MCLHGETERQEPGMRMHFYDISITEHKKILKECERIKPQAVATIGSDLANITVQYLAEKLGLPGKQQGMYLLFHQ